MLIEAAKQDHLELLKLLIDKGGDVNAVDNVINTLLYSFDDEIGKMVSPNLGVCISQRLGTSSQTSTRIRSRC